MVNYILCLFFIVGSWSVAAGQAFTIKKLDLSKRYTAEYACSINEFYNQISVVDSNEQSEWVKTLVTMNVTQDILTKKRHYIQADYQQSDFVRMDASAKPGSETDTSSNRGKSPLIKMILQHDEKGNFLGPVLELHNPAFIQRDFKYFYNTAKSLVFLISDSALKKESWQTWQTDTLLNPGFELVFNYTLNWRTAGELDTMGLHCIRITYASPAHDYFTINPVMKAIGKEVIHTGIATIDGEVLLDAKTGRVIKLSENGGFTGEMTMTTDGKTEKWPTAFAYHKQFNLTKLTKNPRKKIWGIF